MDLKRFWQSAAVVASGVVALTACSSSDNAGAPPTTTQTTSVNTPPSSTASDPMSGANACQILDAAVKGEGYPPSKQSAAIKSFQLCRTQTSKPDVKSIALGFPNKEYTDIVGDVVKGDVNGRPAALAEDKDTGDCEISMQLPGGKSASVQFGVEGGREDKDCKHTEAIAKKIEPQLPKVQG